MDDSEKVRISSRNELRELLLAAILTGLLIATLL